MANRESFINDIKEGYTFKGDSLVLGGAMLGEEVISGLHVSAPLATFNRHGLIAGATGTGKTKTMQVLTEQLSKAGVPVLLMDVKGDLSGLAKASPGHEKIDERHEAIGNLPFEAEAMPVELMSISEDYGVPLRATVSEFGPVLLSKMLGLSEAQSSIIAVLFKYCDDNGLALLDLKDIKGLFKYILDGDNVKDKIESEYGALNTGSITAMLRKVVELEEQGGDLFFGEPSFEVKDLTRTDSKGRGYVSVLRVTDIQDRPKLFSTFMLALLAEIYNEFPEAGDIDKPKLVFVIDEAHLIFDEASDAVLSQLESVIKLIRSKGVGLFFLTQNPADIPDSILGQLGMKVQHALRAFTAKDRKAIKLAAQNYPISDHYDTTEVLTQLGIGEALISVLDRKGRPTPLVRSMMRAPVSRMDVLTKGELSDLIADSNLVKKYGEVNDRESAYEILGKKMEAAKKAAAEELAAEEKAKAAEKKAKEKAKSSGRSRKSTSRRTGNKTVNDLDKATKMASRVLRMSKSREGRALFGVLKKVLGK